MAVRADTAKDNRAEPSAILHQQEKLVDGNDQIQIKKHNADLVLDQFTYKGAGQIQFGCALQDNPLSSLIIDAGGGARVVLRTQPLSMCNRSENTSKAQLGQRVSSPAAARMAATDTDCVPNGQAGVVYSHIHREHSTPTVFSGERSSAQDDQTSILRIVGAPPNQHAHGEQRCGSGAVAVANGDAASAAVKVASAARKISAEINVSDDDDVMFEVPYADELPSDEELTVSLQRHGSRPLGVVLDQANVLVAVRAQTPAAASELQLGDQIIGVEGAACTEGDLRAAQLLRMLPAHLAECRLRIRRPYIPDLHLPSQEQLEASMQNQHAAAEDQKRQGQPVQQAQLQTQQQLVQGNVHTRSHALEASQGQSLRKRASDSPDEPAAAPNTASAGSRSSAASNEHARERSTPGDGATLRLKHMWRQQARQPLDTRLQMARTLKGEGNDKFTAADFDGALKEYEFALQLFEYEIANLGRDQEVAELGDLGRGLGSDDLRRIQKIRVPCLLNIAAAHVKMGEGCSGSEGEGGGSKSRGDRGTTRASHMTSALEAVAKVLQAAPAAPVRAKAHFRAAQAHSALGNVREAWQSASIARELRPDSDEIRELQLRLQHSLRELQRSEQAARGGVFKRAAHLDLLARDERKEHRRKRALLFKLLPVADRDEGLRAAVKGGDDDDSHERALEERRRAEVLLDKIAVAGWSCLTSAEKAAFEKVWSAGLPRLSAAEIKEGRHEGVFPPREQEKVFGPNLPLALQGKPLIGAVCWLSAEQRRRVVAMGLEALRRGVEALSHEQRRFCEAIGLLSPTDARCVWHRRPLGDGGAQLILSPARQHLWPFPPPCLAVTPATMGAELPDEQVGALNQRARRPLSRGELGILLSNRQCWTHALELKWEWCLVLEDDAEFLHGSALQLLGLLEHLVHAASQLEPNWQLLVLSPVDTDDFVACISDDAHAPSLLCDRRLRACARTSPNAAPLDDSGWRRIGPTCHAFAWIYRAQLMKHLLDGFAQMEPPLNPLDVWTWEVMHEHGMLDLALAPDELLVSARRGVGSVKEAQGHDE